MRQYAFSVPEELIDVARIDGVSQSWILIIVVFPLLRLACLTYGLLSLLWIWNEFLWPLVMLTDQEMMPLPIALATLKGHLITRYGSLMAGAVVAVGVFIFLQKYIVRGIALTCQGKHN